MDLKKQFRRGVRCGGRATKWVACCVKGWCLAWRSRILRRGGGQVVKMVVVSYGEYLMVRKRSGESRTVGDRDKAKADSPDMHILKGNKEKVKTGLQEVHIRVSSVYVCVFSLLGVY
jgi:hypothetical protein